MMSEDEEGCFEVYKQKGLVNKAADFQCPEPFLSTLQKVNFCQTSNIFCMLAVFFRILKNYHPMQKIMSVVIGVYKFGQEFFIIGIF